MEKLIAAIPKNQREEIRVALSEFEKDGTTYDMSAPGCTTTPATARCGPAGTG